MQFVLYVLATVGALCVLWCVFGWMLLGRDSGCCVVPLRDAGGCMERQIRLLLWLQQTGILRTKLILLDCGLGKEERGVVERLEREFPELTLCGTDELWKEIGKE